MYSKTKVAASPLRPPGNALVTVGVLMPSPRERRDVAAVMLSPGDDRVVEGGHLVGSPIT